MPARLPHYGMGSSFGDQALLTLNLLRTSRVNPKISSHVYLFCNHDFNRVPLVPPGSKLIVHNKSGNRLSWSFHGDDAWSNGPASEHYYRCIKCYIPKTRATHITDTFSIIPTVIPISDYSIEEKIHEKMTKLVNLLDSHRQMKKNKNPSLK